LQWLPYGSSAENDFSKQWDFAEAFLIVGSLSKTRRFTSTMLEITTFEKFVLELPLLKTESQVLQKALCN